MISTALETFAAYSTTNIDDIVLLMLLFSRLDEQFRGIHVVTGQFLGTFALITASLLGFAGQAVIPQAWIGLFGLLPISLGVSQLIENMAPTSNLCKEYNNSTSSSLGDVSGIGCAGIVGVATLTMANGCDNISVYMPMFAHAKQNELLLMLFVFSVMTACWCMLAWWLTKTPAIARLLHRYAASLLPAVLIGIGGLILADSHVFQEPPQAVITLCCLIIMVISVLKQLQDLLNTRGLPGVQQP